MKNTTKLKQIRQKTIRLTFLNLAKLLMVLGVFIAAFGLSKEVKGQCSNCNANYPSGTFSTTSSTLTTVSTCMYGGEYAYFNVTSGATYTWTTCGDSSFDTQLTLFSGSSCGGTSLAYNDDACSLQSTITWTATFTGTVTILVSEYYCNNYSACMTLQWSVSGGSAPSCDYSVPYSGNNSITASSGFICDENGWGYDYINNANGYTVINPVSAGDMVSLSFTHFNTESGWDYVYIYDGTGTTGALLWSGSGTTLPSVQTSTTGPLTIRFDSDGSVSYYDGFRAEISNVCCPTITGQPSDASICEGDNTNLSITSDCGSCSCTYQWQLNGSDIAGATSATYSANPATTSDYQCIVTAGGLTSTTSDVATVIVNPYPTNVSAGSDVTICNGSSVQLSGSADDQTIGGLTIFEDNFSTDKGWSLETNWGRGSVTSEPSSDNTSTADNYALACPLNSDYGTYWGTYYATSPIINCTNYNTVNFELYSFSGCESNSWDHMGIQVYNGSSWVTIWSNGSSFQENSWNHNSYDVTAHAAGVSNFQVRFYMGTTDGSVTYSGWAIDDLKITGDATVSSSYTWSPSASLDNPNISNPTASPLSTTTYTMTADINGCSVQDDVYVDLYDGTWTGVEDENWHQPNNWCNGVPTSTDDVIISSNAVNMPEIHYNIANVHNLTILHGASLVIYNDQILNISGDLLNQGNLSIANGNETIVMQGNNSTLNTNGNAINNLVVQGSNSIVNIQNSFDILGELDIQDGSINLGSYTIQISGNITIDGVLNAGTSTVELVASAVQNLNTNGSNAVFNNLTITNSTANLSEIILGSDLHIAGHLQLNQGIIDGTIAPYKVKLLSGATANNGNANSFVNGEVERTGTTAFIYPIGDVANIGGTDRAIWAPVETDACASSTISANYYYENPPYDWWYHGGNIEATIDHISDREYWDLVTDNAKPAVTIYWTDNTDDLHSFGATSGELTSTFLANNMTIAHYNTALGKWDDMGATIPAGSIYFDDGSIKTTTAFSSYSPITFASKNPTFTLPVELVDLSAFCMDEYVKINWTSTTEINNEYYLIEHSKDGISWETIAKVPGAGNSNTTIDYQVIDENFNTSINYYRLTQFDFDGSSETFEIRTVNCENEKIDPEITIYPNPFTNELNLMALNWTANGKVIINLTDMTGRVLQNYNAHINNQSFHLLMRLNNLTPGMYIVEIQAENFNERYKVQKQ